MNRRTVLKTIGAGALGAAGALGSSGSAMAGHGGNHYYNPMWEPHFPDPTVYNAGGTYYAYGTNMDRDDGSNDSEELLVPILSSTDLVNWTYEGEAFTSRPGWTYGSIWAPDIHYANGEYVMFYSLEPRPWESGEFGIGLATSSSPTGPFTDHGQVIGDSDTGGGTIDGYYVEYNNTPYLFWGSFQGIYVAELTADLQDVDMSTATQVAGDAYEGTIHFERNGYHYLFVSTGTCCDGLSSTYEIEVGRSTSFFGPYYDESGVDLMNYNNHNQGNAILTGNSRFPGPGHGDITTYSDGSDWLLYHAYDSQDGGWVDGVPRRVLMVDRIDWENDWPVIACDGTPSEEASVPGESSSCGGGGGGGGPIAEGRYWIENVASGKALDVNANEIDQDGGNVLQWGYWGGANQQWDAFQNGDGTYHFVNVESGKLLEVDAADTSDGANVQQYADTGCACQDWNVVDNGDGTYRLEAAHSGKVADLENGSTDDGANILQWGWWGGDNQKWVFNGV